MHPNRGLALTDLFASLCQQYGPLMGGNDLRKSLGFRSADSFERAVRSGSLGVSVFTLVGRRGKFALTSDVAEWLVTQRDRAASNSAEEKQ